MHWYLLQYGYGSIPINTIFSGMNIHLPAILMFTRGSRFWHTAIWATIFYYILTMLWHSNVSHTTSGTRNASTNRGSTNLKRRKSAAIGTPCSTSMSIFHHLPMKIWAKVQAKAAVDRSLHGVLRYFFSSGTVWILVLVSWKSFWKKLPIKHSLGSHVGKILPSPPWKKHF